jgi:hypothetical protein
MIKANHKYLALSRELARRRYEGYSQKMCRQPSDQFEASYKEKSRHGGTQRSLWNVAGDETSQPDSRNRSDEQAEDQRQIDVAQAPMSECSYPDENDAVEYVAADEPVEPLGGKQKKKRGYDEAAASNRGEGNDHADNEPEQRNLPAFDIVICRRTLGRGRSKALQVSLEDDAEGNDDECAAEQTDN